MSDTIDRNDPRVHIVMMQTPDAWPLGSLLALVRGTPPNQELGVLVVGHDPRYAVFLTPMGIFDMRLTSAVMGAETTELETEVYTDAEAVYDAGWRVD